MKYRKTILKEAGVLLIVAILVLTSLFVLTPLTIVTKATPSVVWFEYFSGGVPPTGWSTTHPLNWKSSATAHAGGTAPEAMFSWSPSGIDTFRLHTTTPIDLAAYTNCELYFWHYVNDYIGIYDLKVEIKPVGTTWSTIWTTSGGPIGPVQEGPFPVAGVFDLSFTFYGDSYNINFWYIDNVEIYCDDTNDPPDTPGLPDGTPPYYICEPYTFFAQTDDPQLDQVAYQFDWDAAGAHDYSDWSDWHTSGVQCSMSHSWGEPGTYEIKVRAKDTYDAESDWSASLTVIVENRCPNVPNTPTPDDGATGVSVDTVLSWNGGDPDSCDTVEYEVRFATTEGALISASSILATVSDTTIDPADYRPPLQHDTKYYWKVIASDGICAKENLPWSFTTCPIEIKDATGADPDGIYVETAGVNEFIVVEVYNHHWATILNIGWSLYFDFSGGSITYQILGSGSPVTSNVPFTITGTIDTIASHSSEKIKIRLNGNACFELTATVGCAIPKTVNGCVGLTICP